MSYIGNNELGRLFLGNVEIDKVYLGNDLVFDSGPVEHTFTAYLSSYDQSNSVFGTLNNESRAYGDINTSN